MEPVRFGVIGCGVMGRRHAAEAAASELAALVAVADIRAEAAESTAQNAGGCRVHGDGGALLDDADVEAVVLAMPAGVRADLAVRALQAGKHLLVEKPVACNTAEVERMIAARGELVAGCCSCRFSLMRSAKAARDFYATGALGELRLLRCRGVRHDNGPPKRTPPPWRVSHELNGGGILVNWGCYDLDYLFSIIGWRIRPRVVLAQAWPVAAHAANRVAPGSDAETHIAVLVQCEDDVAVTVERGEFVATADDGAWQIVGSKGSLRLAITPGQGDSVIHDGGSADAPVTSTPIWTGDRRPDVVGAGLLQDFAHAIRAGVQPMTNLERSLILQQITDAAYASARNGGAVDID